MPLPLALALWPALCALAFAIEYATRPPTCGLCANPRPHRGHVPTMHGPRHTTVGICADCYALTHTMERTTNV